MNIGLVGFGVSNRAVYEHFKSKHKIFVHNREKIPLPSDATPVFDRYLECNEDIVFRSPSVRRDKIKTNAPIYCEATYALDKIKGRKICVSGSDGKTTTSSLIFEILRSKNAYLGGNIGKDLISTIDKNYDFTVAELSSFQLMDASPKCDYAILTTITENHLDYHLNMDEYISSKENLLKNANHIILNYDCEILRDLGKKYEGVKYFSLSHKCDAYICDGFIMLHGKKLFEISKIKLRGKYNQLNILASILATEEYATLSEIENAVCSFGGVCHRCELIREISGVKFYNSSIDSTPSRTVATLKDFEKSRSIVILGGRNKNLSYEILGKELKGLKCAIILGENRNEILCSLNSYVDNIYLVNNLSEAVHLGYKIAKNGDSVILSPASTSFDMYKSYTERGEYFKKIVNSL